MPHRESRFVLDRLKAWWAADADLVWALLKQLRYPVAIAAAYGLWDWHESSQPFSLRAYLKLTMPALFFIMWIIGLYQREKKRTDDRESFGTLSSGLQSLTELVQKLTGAPHAASAPPSTVGTSFSSHLMSEAMNVYSAGHKLASLLQAGVAFEHAVRAFARRHGVENAEQMPLLRILQKIDFLLPQGWKGEFHTLRQIRNQLAHASEQELDRIERPDLVLNTYAAAIETLNQGQ
jgi:hypothetical protein